MADIDQVLDGMVGKLGGREVLGDTRIRRQIGVLTVGELRGSFVNIFDPVTLRELTEIDLGIFHTANGFDGAVRWIIDGNGKVHRKVDPEAIVEHVVEKRMSDGDYLINRDRYDFSFDAESSPGEYIIQVSDREHRDRPFASITLYVDAESLLTLRSEKIEHGQRQLSMKSGYREIGGVMMATEVRDISPAGGNETTVRIEHLEHLDAVDDGRFAPPAEDVRDFRFLDGGVSSSVPIRVPYNHIFTDVSIGGRSYEFVVDTGASATVLGMDLVRELGLEILGTMQAQGVSGPQEMAFVRLPEMIVGGVVLERQQVIAIDFEQMHARLPNMRGLLGMDFLNRFVVKLDYVAGEMEIHDREHFVYHGDGERLAINGSEVMMSFDGHEGKFHIDTGAGGVVIHAPFVKKWNLLPDPEKVPSASSIAGVGNVELRRYCSRSHRIGIGSFELSDAPVEFTDIETGAFANEAVIGNVGGMIWRRFITWFDFTGGWMILEPNSNFNEPYRENRLGLGLKIDQGLYVVDSITSHAPASRLGLERGDALLEIDGRPAAGMTIAELQLLMCASAGTRRRMTFRDRLGRERQVDVLLEDFVKHYDA